jgi:hypothetical protein
VGWIYLIYSAAGFARISVLLCFVSTSTVRYVYANFALRIARSISLTHHPRPRAYIIRLDHPTCGVHDVSSSRKFRASDKKCLYGFKRASVAPS